MAKNVIGGWHLSPRATRILNTPRGRAIARRIRRRCWVTPFLGLRDPVYRRLMHRMFLLELCDEMGVRP